MFNRWVDAYATFMVNTFGYDLAVRLEDIFYGAGMHVLGASSMAFLGAFFILRLHGVEDFGQGKLRILCYDNIKKFTQFVQIRYYYTVCDIAIIRPIKNGNS